MKKLILTAALMVSTTAFADRSTVCMYQANGSQGPVTVKMTFTQDDYYNTKSAKLQYYTRDGVNEVRIPKKAIKSLVVNAPGLGSEMAVNVFIQSREVDMVLNYSGNDFANDALEWRDWHGRRASLVQIYSELEGAGPVQHRMEYGEPVVQMTGSVRWDGTLNKIASKNFVCSTMSEIPAPEEEPGC